ncbi:MAG: tRNA (adenosine(37)-N6)-dimethylallyltransferase MiaA [Clostridia bacterium]|nr:tRNA (adenosine(37)-N6)-dimethylallyltransferase MiaA [Clostridia bacterium]
MLKTEQIKALAVVGPTAVGKTAFAIALAKRYGGEIISCDSMQIYRGMDIGTAKATKEEQAQVPHHMIDICSPQRAYSAADYAKEAYQAAMDIAARGKIPILCGGTGLYLEAVRTGRHENEAVTDEAYRATLSALADEKGAEYVYEMLTRVDREAAEATHPNNLKRVIRALEIYHTTGKTKTEWDRETAKKPPKIDLLTFCLLWRDRDCLYRRIDKRVDEMVNEGLWEEALRIYQIKDIALTAAQAIGYKEMFACFRGEMSKEEAIEAIKQASRHYAKRQLTWFLAKPHIPLYRDSEEGEIVPSEALEEEAALSISAFLDT